MNIHVQFGFNHICISSFFSETTGLIGTKLSRNVPWMVLYKISLFRSDMKFKMAATAGLSLTLDPMGKMLFRRRSLKCEKFTDDRRRTPSDGNSSPGPFGPGELKNKPKFCKGA
jgi:hypothetical protein